MHTQWMQIYLGDFFSVKLTQDSGECLPVPLEAEYICLPQSLHLIPPPN